MSDFRLALFTDTYAPDVNGAAKTLERWIVYLRSKGIPCMVFAPSSEGGKAGVLTSAADERIASVPFFLYPEVRLAIPQIVGVEQKLLDFKPSVIHVATPFGAGISGRHLALKHGIPLVASHHTHFSRYLQFYKLQWMSKILWKYLYWFHRQARRIYVPSRSVLEECQKDGWAGLEIWSRGIDGNLFHPHVDRASVLSDAGISQDQFIVLYAGRLAQEKQPELAIEAMNRFVRLSGAKAKLVVAGDGPLLPALKDLALRTNTSVHFIGALPQIQLQKWMAASDVLLFSSPTETFGNIVLEAMACGLPIIAADAGAVPDTVIDGMNGLLCSPGSSSSFADALCRMYEDSLLRAKLAAAGLSEAGTRSWDEVFARLLASMEEAASGQAASFHMRAV
ncbi:glycosyltransferase family 4 protein [Gorillibacterium massiliense]|uniref:glycosyltransferase family 4 protein n=1 Tax=Gorillibacterium massiliense TaxID=1280390 RepID=UPI0004B32FB1|nr:glycosyltransferase family 1 protein [Gorillibacterium massiliense]